MPATETSSQMTGISAQILNGFTSSPRHAEASGKRAEVKFGEVHEFLMQNEPEDLVIALFRHSKQVNVKRWWRASGAVGLCTESTQRETAALSLTCMLPGRLEAKRCSEATCYI